ncbi:hypothetical protein FACS1894182_07620 [Bacteroidia bacterium]|nr:hypothetical protein FACS1894182_07620 [Bacteroidia bacterium]
MKKTLLSFILLLFAAIVYSQTINLDGLEYTVDTLENHQVGPGTQYVRLYLTAPSKRLDVYFLIADLNNPNITIRAALGRDSIYGGETPSTTAKRLSTDGTFYFAGTNGDFYDTSLQYAGYPVSGNMINNEMAKIPGGRQVYAFDANKQSYIGLMQYAGNLKSGAETWTINSINHTRETNDLKLYNQFNGKYTHTNPYGTEVEIELINGDTWGVNRTLHAKVTKIEKNIGNMAIPKGKAVLSGHGTSADKLNTLAIGNEIELNLNLTMEGNIKTEFTQMTGGDNYAPIIKNGVVETSNFWNELHPRTGLGYSMTKDSLIFCVVDGRGASNGCTTRVLGTIMKSAGAYDAMNMDGGGSSAMYIAEYGAPVNRTSDGPERAVGNSIFVVATCPADNVVTTIVPYSTLIKIPQYGVYETHFRSYNQYGVLIDHDLSGVVLSAPAELGVVNGAQFTCTGTEPGILTATYNGTVTAQITVIPTPTSSVEILLDSVQIDKYKDYAIEVSALTADGVQPILAEVLAWKVENPTIAAVENGVLKALSNGTTYAVGTLGELTDTIYVTVENPAAPREVSDVFIPGEWTVSTINEFKPDMTFNTGNVPVAWEHGAAVNFTYKAGRGPFVQLLKDYRLYGLPDTVKIVANTGSLQLKNAVISLRANNAGQTLYQYTINAPFPANTDFDLSVPVASLFEGAGIAIYPLYFNKVNFNIETSNTIGANYTIALKEIALIYKGAPGTAIIVPQTAAFSIYPNPVKGNEIHIRLENGQKQTLQVEIYTLSGQKVQSETVNAQGGTAGFTRKNLPAGIYLMKIRCNERFETVKLIIQ